MTFCYPWDAVFKIFFYSIFTWRIFRPSTESQRPLWHTAMTAMDRSLFLSIKFLMQDAPRRPGLRCGSPSRLLSRTPSWNFCWLQTRRKKIFFLESLSEPIIFFQAYPSREHRSTTITGKAPVAPLQLFVIKLSLSLSKPEHCTCPPKLNQ